MAFLSNKQKFALFLALPHHWVSRVVYFITRLRGPQVTPMIRWFVRRYEVDMSEAADPEIEHYQTFNAFFTRPLKADSRPLASGDNTLVCPCDGTVSQAGTISNGKILQAKGKSYALSELVGGDAAMTTSFVNGRYATLYLAPHNYHRVHMPLAARLDRMLHVPGRLFSVARWTVETIPRIFARNERLVCHFESAAGPLAMVMVGAINVAAIETAWCGLVTPPRGKKITHYHYNDNRDTIDQGAEMGRFNMGSTVILLTGDRVEWLPTLKAGQIIKMGQLIGRFD